MKDKCKLLEYSHFVPKNDVNLSRKGYDPIESKTKELRKEVKTSILKNRNASINSEWDSKVRVKPKLF